MAKIEDFVGDKHNYCEKMKKEKGWADPVIVWETAKYLKRNIKIITSSPSSNAYNYITLISGNEETDANPLLLGHEWKFHYISLTPRGNVRSANLVIHQLPEG